MVSTISRDSLFQIKEVMNSRQDSDSFYGYIDYKTGEVLIGSEEEPLEILPNEEDENYEELEAAFERQYLPIPQKGSRDAYQDMVAFIETVEDERLQDLLQVAIQGRGAFGRFKDVLRRSEYELEQARWFSFSEQRNYQRATEWLAANGLSVEG